MRPLKQKRQLTLKEISENRNKVLFIRSVPALGDIMMHRMLFEDVKILSPGLEVHFACPAAYHPAVSDHPFLDKVLDCNTVDRHEYKIYYVNDRACTDYEERIAPLSDKHRSDIWAEHCGFSLTRHDMHIRLTEKEKADGQLILDQFRHRNGPIVLFTPISSRTPQRTLTEAQVNGVVEGLTARGYCPLGVHNSPLSYMKAPVICDLTIRQLFGIIYQADYVISVDTGTLHCAGGMGKPTVGVFTSADGDVYGKYYPRFELVQKHRNHDPNWTCGPCYTWTKCPKCKSVPKPCLTELTSDMILDGFSRLVMKYPEKACSTNN